MPFHVNILSSERALGRAALTEGEKPRSLAAAVTTSHLSCPTADANRVPARAAVCPMGRSSDVAGCREVLVPRLPMPDDGRTPASLLPHLTGWLQPGLCSVGSAGGAEAPMLAEGQRRGVTRGSGTPPGAGPAALQLRVALAAQDGCQSIPRPPSVPPAAGKEGFSEVVFFPRSR